jgi:5-methylcytosine-specific restriction endonuclease McrA
MLNIRKSKVDVYCKGCGKTHSRKQYEAFPEARKVFDEAYAHKRLQLQSPVAVEEEAEVEAAEAEETESESEEEEEEEVVPVLRKPVKSRKPQYVGASELEDKQKEWRKLTDELALSHQAAVEAYPAKSGKKEKIKPFLKDMLWTRYHTSADVAQCPICTVKRIFPENFDAGHIIPESYGGETTLDNLRPICKTCNSSMGTTHMFTYAWVQHRRPMFR